MKQKRMENQRTRSRDASSTDEKFFTKKNPVIKPSELVSCRAAQACVRVPRLIHHCWSVDSNHTIQGTCLNYRRVCVCVCGYQMYMTKAISDQS